MELIIDYKSGDVYGVKATTTSSLTSAAYKINQAKTDTSVTLSTGDVEIGAVEIKNATDDTRATVGANGLYVDVRAMPAGGLTTYSAQTTIGHGVKTVTTAGTDEALAASTACKRVIIQAQTDNTGKIAVGASGVDATIATGTGVLLEPGDAIELDTANLATVYIDSTVNGEGVRYTYFA